MCQNETKVKLNGSKVTLNLNFLMWNQTPIMVGTVPHTFENWEIS